MRAGDTHTAARLVGLTDVRRAGVEADSAVVTRWLDDGVAPNGGRGRAFGTRSVHGFDLTFAAPKSASLLRALRADDVVQKAIAAAHSAAPSEAMGTWPRMPPIPTYTTAIPQQPHRACCTDL
ncbi:relaxase domain-containing protein [Mycobacterium basiliense]|uniref:relaxase domain-containing protein n=1 Tax=Mycobacterium basiliense TaxID=2094119 RepID=UPI0039F08147